MLERGQVRAARADGHDDAILDTDARAFAELDALRSFGGPLNAAPLADEQGASRRAELA